MAKITHIDGRIIVEDDLPSTSETLEAAVQRKANLDGANLRKANLIGADLDGADLRKANLRIANLDGANLIGANLDGANLDGANLRMANLRMANLIGANLDGAKGIWRSHDVIAEILRRAAGADVEKRKITGLILISRDWCWNDFLRIDSPLREWVFDTLVPWAADDPLAPDVMCSHIAAREVTA